MIYCRGNPLDGYEAMFDMYGMALTVGSDPQGATFMGVPLSRAVLLTGRAYSKKQAIDDLWRQLRECGGDA